MKNITLLGSTGSIGTSALKIIDANKDKYRVIALTGGRNLDLLEEQVRRFRPKGVALLEEGLADTLRTRLSGDIKTEVFSGREGFIHLATLDETDTVISAMTGAAGLVPTYAAVEEGKNIALANKETMVLAGELVMNRAQEKGASVLPIDSEHCAILQCLQGHPAEDLRRIILTASGGPFRNFSLEEMASVTPEQALRHPNWNMGRKITIDSATLMNKGLETIEAKWLFGLNMDQISIVIHPQSIVHSMVEYKDGSIIAQMGVPDMMIPISYALSFPRHLDTPLPILEIEEVGSLSFEKCERERFKCLDLALRAADIGGSMPAVMNGANEIAVDAFLGNMIEFLQIPVLIEKTMDAHETFQLDGIESVMAADIWAREKGREILGNISH